MDNEREVIMDLVDFIDLLTAIIEERAPSALTEELANRGMALIVRAANFTEQ